MSQRFVSKKVLKVIELCRGPFANYVSTFLTIFDQLSTPNKQKLTFSDPPSPPTSADVIYEWSHRGPFVNYVSIFLPILDQVSTLSKHKYLLNRPIK